MDSVKFEDLGRSGYRVGEAYKALRSNVQFCGKDVKVICFTSCTPNEGKSSVAFNLCRSFAEDGKHVLLIDADMRKSVLAGRYKAGAVETGLTHYLAGQKSMDEAIMHTNIENMDIIFSGPYAPNPTELLGSALFEELTKKSREEYDYVFIDTPPLGSVIDGAVAARASDGVVIVIEADAINYKFAQETKRQLEMAGVKILGAVLNKAGGGAGKYGKYGKYGPYGAYAQ